MPQDQFKRRLSVRSDRRDPPDYRKLSRALIALAQAQAEKEAQDEHQTLQKRIRRRGNQQPGDAA
ncbi:MAG: hypothetical protein M3O32_00365 [Actinomycetota bacterium]|nr:hypothetical protein [Actinomycetota bacterium]